MVDYILRFRNRTSQTTVNQELRVRRMIPFKAMTRDNTLFDHFLMLFNSFQ